MGSQNSVCIPARNAEDRERQLKTEQIDAELKAEKRKLKDQVKLLLLGTGDSGKSTIAKQMKIIHLAGFNDDERRKFRMIIHMSIVNDIKALLRQIEERQLKLQPENEERADTIRKLEVHSQDALNYTVELADTISLLWRDEATQEALTKTTTFYLGDSAAYFLNKAKDFADQNYLPTEQDILRVRVKTTGITEVEFLLVDTQIKMVDVGGQRSERKKWIHCFNEVTAIIYVVAMSEYDLVLEEASNVNRMQESLKQFRDIVNNVWFQQTPIILFMNKMDVFQQKVTRVDPIVCFPEYTGGCNVDNAKKFIQQKFEGIDLRTVSSRKIYSHFTTATDTQNIRHVFNDVRHILLERTIVDSGIV